MFCIGSDRGLLAVALSIAQGVQRNEITGLRKAMRNAQGIPGAQ